MERGIFMVNLPLSVLLVTAKTDVIQPLLAQIATITVTSISEKPSPSDVGGGDVVVWDMAGGADNSDLADLPTDFDLPIVVLVAPQDVSGRVTALVERGASDVMAASNPLPPDFTERLRMAVLRHDQRRELEQQAKRYHNIIHGHSEFIIRFNTNFKLTFVNAAYLEARQQEESALLNTDALYTVSELDHESLRETIDFLSPKEADTTHEVRAYPSEKGREIWHHWATRAFFDEDGRTTEYQSVIRNVTERKVVENELSGRLTELRVLRRVDAELTDSLKLKNVVTFALDSAMRLSGADVAVIALYQEATEELIVQEAYGLEDLEGIRQLYRDRLGLVQRIQKEREPLLISDMHECADCIASRPEMAAQMVIPLLSQDRLMGTISLETAQAGRFTEQTFEFLQLVAARIGVALDNARLYDVQRSQLEELQKLYEQVTALEQLKTDMIRIASHDLRNPIGVMQGYIEMLQMDIQSNEFDVEKFGEHLEAIQKMTRRMRRITADILSVDRIERTNEAGMEGIDLTLIIREVVEEHAYLASSKGQQYHVNLPGLPTYITGDYAQLREAAANLIGNAIKYTPDAGTITISLEFDGDAAVFEVTDTGYGIPYEMQQRLFQPFYRAKTRETAAIEGTGLGLHLVKNIVERHKGRMIFRSRYREGSTFGFQIPILNQDT
jgi:PAS domain S-box-containing protein